jgi:hypothetical protein
MKKQTMIVFMTSSGRFPRQALKLCSLFGYADFFLKRRFHLTSTGTIQDLSDFDSLFENLNIDDDFQGGDDDDDDNQVPQ